MRLALERPSMIRLNELKLYSNFRRVCFLSRLFVDTSVALVR